MPNPEPVPVPDSWEVFVVGNASAVSEAIRYLKGEGMTVHEEVPSTSAPLVLFVVSGLDGGMWHKSNIPLKSVPAQTPDQAAILLVDSARVTDVEVRQIVFVETADELTKRGQPDASQFAQILDDADGMKTIASFYAEAHP